MVTGWSARFDGWSDQFKAEVWHQAFVETGLDPNFYARRPRPLDELLPWDVVDAGVTKEYLAGDYQAALRKETHPDCREQCAACGILSAFRRERAGVASGAWACP